MRGFNQLGISGGVSVFSKRIEVLKLISVLLAVGMLLGFSIL